VTFEKPGWVGSARLSGPRRFGRLADTTSIGGTTRPAETMNPLRPLSRRHSKTVTDSLPERLDRLPGVIKPGWSR
jgi:hypothetical protein